MREAVAVTAGAEAAADATLRLSVTADVLVTGRRTFRNVADVAEPGDSLVGIADASTQGAVTAEQIELRPMARAGDILETVPGVVISQHSGEGKANQYYLRGFNLDHGTDFATTVAGVQVNLPDARPRPRLHRPELRGSGARLRHPVQARAPTSSRTATSPPPARPTSTTSTSSTRRSRGSDGGSYQLPARPLRGFAEGRRRQSPLRDRRRLQQRPLGSGRTAIRKYNGVLRYSVGDARNGFAAHADGPTARTGTRPTRSPRARSTTVRSTGSARSTRPTAASRGGSRGSLEWQRSDAESVTRAVALRSRLRRWTCSPISPISGTIRSMATSSSSSTTATPTA